MCSVVYVGFMLCKRPFLVDVEQKFAYIFFYYIHTHTLTSSLKCESRAYKQIHFSVCVCNVCYMHFCKKSLMSSSRVALLRFSNAVASSSMACTLHTRTHTPTHIMHSLMVL